MHSLKDLDGSEGTVQLHAKSSDGHLILHPTPNPLDPNDPLRWPTWKKHTCFGAVCAFTFLTNYAIGGLAPAFYTLSIQFDRTQTETSALLIWPILVLGVFNFFWVPVSQLPDPSGLALPLTFFSGGKLFRQKTSLCVLLSAAGSVLSLGSSGGVVREPALEQYHRRFCWQCNRGRGRCYCQ